MKVLSNLTFQVLVAILLGVLVGLYFPQFAPTAKIISANFVKLIQWLIAPIIFLTIVLGIASMGAGMLGSMTRVWPSSMTILPEAV